jgi:hypothetical protein
MVRVQQSESSLGRSKASQVLRLEAKRWYMTFDITQQLEALGMSNPCEANGVGTSDCSR